MIVRGEEPQDVDGVRAVHLASFPTSAEADLVQQLDADGDVVFSLVAVHDERIVGHALFSRMRTPPQSLGLAPVAVLPDFRRRGIAEALIREGLRQAQAQDWQAVFVLGGEYYRRFGFDPALAAGFASVYAGPHLMALALHPGMPRHGSLEYARAFEALS
ncbi:MAG TPA: N-acetyltransferase [Terriglobales bacterium]|nr:N-acetyltransferase [Terriglobales bacterium]